jgi:hypothetical protein
MFENCSGSGRSVLDEDKRGSNMIRSLTVHVSVFIAVLLSLGCREDTDGTAAETGPRAEDMSRAPVEVIITIDPGIVDLRKDILLDIRITAPSEIDVILPALEDRLTGFTLNGMFDEEPVTRQGRTTLERRARLSPLLSDEYRLAPMAIQYVDRSRSPARSSWFPTRPIVLETTIPGQGRTAADIDDSMSPVWIRPPFKTVGGYVLLVIVIAGTVALAWRLLRRIHRKIRLMRMSPKELALHQLSELLSKDLPARDMVKEFYLELTMIVRLYIERAHRVRAPEQTTEEFLDAVTHDPRFSQEVVKKLEVFLQAADLVKFAAYHPEPEAIGRATGTARNYIETDAETNPITEQVEPNHRRAKDPD